MPNLAPHLECNAHSRLAHVVSCIGRVPAAGRASSQAKNGLRNVLPGQWVSLSGASCSNGAACAGAAHSNSAAATGEHVEALHADPRKMERDELLAVCQLWYLQDGSFLQSERQGQFDSNSDIPRPSTPEQILHHRLLHNLMPDDKLYSRERWHFVWENQDNVLNESEETGELVCLAIARSFVREACSADGSPEFPMLGLSGVVTHPKARRRGLGAAVVRSAFARVEAESLAACLFATPPKADTPGKELAEFYTNLGAVELPNPVANATQHAGGHLGPFEPPNSVYQFPATTLVCEPGVVLDIGGRGW